MGSYGHPAFNPLGKAPAYQRTRGVLQLAGVTPVDLVVNDNVLHLPIAMGLGFLRATAPQYCGR